MAQLFVIIICICFTSSALAKGSSLVNLEYNYQRPGGDYTNFRTTGARECAQQCEKSSRCQAFDYYKSDNSCWLKSKAYPARSYTGVISGVKRKRVESSGPPPLASVSGMNLRYDTQRPGGDYIRLQVQSVQQCAEKCTKDSQCVAFDYTTSDSFCYLKSWKPPVRKYKGIISGVKKRYNIQVKFVQKLLMLQGYNPGVADGQMGKNTKIALKNYQSDQRIVVTGRIDKATLAALGLSTGTENIPQASSVENQDTETSEENIKDNMRLYVETVGVTYLQLVDDIYAKILAKIPANTLLEVLSHKGEWYEVSFQNQVGFVLAESVQVSPKPEQQIRHGGKNAFSTIPGEEFVSPVNETTGEAAEVDMSIEEEFAQ